MVSREYRWKLRNGGRKEICPACGQRRFVPYVSSKDGRTIATNERGEAIYGRCDREDNCGYHLYPNQVCDTNIKPVARVKDEPLRFFPAAVRTDVRTNLFTYACRLLGVSRAMKVWNDYRISRDGERTLFWEIDINGEVRAGKSIRYQENGHRCKDDAMPARWLHTSRTWDAFKTGKELQQCFFGEHLLRERADAMVAVVESEKTAAMMSGASPHIIWLACGGSQGLKNEERNKVLNGRKVLLVPDNGQYWSWKAVADKHGWMCTSALEVDPIFQGCDILDYLDAGVLRIRKQNAIKTQLKRN